MEPQTTGQLKLDAPTLREAEHLIQLALTEDLGSAEPEHQLDITTRSVVPENVQGSARFVARQPGIVCGVAVCRQIADRSGRQVTLQVTQNDGDRVQPGDVIATLKGNARDILILERTCLNFLGRLSGIATLTDQYVQLTVGTRAKVLDTRKTTPGWRRLEKFAVRCGGGHNHRLGLFDAVLIKDNHLAMMDAITDEPLAEVTQAIKAARRWIDRHASQLPNGKQTVVEIEVDRIEQLKKALACDEVDIVLLDNMDLATLNSAVAIRDRMAPDLLLEASGGVSLETIGNIAKTGVDWISVGALTHSSVNLDIGLDWILGPSRAEG